VAVEDASVKVATDPVPVTEPLPHAPLPLLEELLHPQNAATTREPATMLRLMLPRYHAGRTRFIRRVIRAMKR
jgi:hypothetical protein